MKRKIKVGIVGYGNLGKGVELGVYGQEDIQLVAVFTRRNPNKIKPFFRQTKVLPIETIEQYESQIDVLILCGSSKEDLQSQTPYYAKKFNTVDSFDIHEEIPTYFEKVHKVAEDSRFVSVISVGWDPGLFSLHRLLGEAIFPEGEVYTFWGKGLSQGHSTAIRRVQGVKDAVQYTIPSKKAMELVRIGRTLEGLEAERHERVCYVVPEQNANFKKIEEDIKSMPHYFAPYKTTVHFISEEEMEKEHRHMAHGGHVISSGVTGRNHKQFMEFSLSLQNNPEFTAQVLIAYARAAFNMYKDGESGAKTIFDIPIKYISPYSSSYLRRKWL